MNEQTKAEIERAVVTILAKGGRGILVSGGVILTAAHCVEYKTEGEMILGDFFLEEIKTSQGEIFKVEPYAVEPVSDLAVLGGLTSQDLYREAMSFEEFSGRTKPAILCTKNYAILEPYQIYIFTHKGEWISGKGFGTDNGVMFFEGEKPIEGGTSGSPIVNDSGELVGIVSNSNQTTGACNGSGPFVSNALPAWILGMIRE